MGTSICAVPLDESLKRSETSHSFFLHYRISLVPNLVSNVQIEANETNKSRVLLFEWVLLFGRVVLDVKMGT